MPELPEVETIARTLAPRIKGRRFAAVDLLYRPLVRTGRKSLAGLAGRRVLDVGRRGKMLIISLGGGRTLVFHLKMTGQFLFAPEGSPRDKHVRLAFRFEDGGNELLFRDVRKFGFLLCLDGGPRTACRELASAPSRSRSGFPNSPPSSRRAGGASSRSSSTRRGSPASATSTPTRCSSTPASIRRRRPAGSRGAASSASTLP